MRRKISKLEAELAIRKMERIDKEIDEGKRKRHTLDEITKRFHKQKKKNLA